MAPGTETAAQTTAVEAPAVNRPAHRGGTPVQRQRRRLFWPFVLPAFILYAVFLILPVAGTAWMSLNEWAGSGPMEYVGFENYTRMFSDPIFMQSFYNTLLLMFGAGAVTFAVSFGLTMILKDAAGKTTVRSIIFFPNLVPALVLAILWGFLFQADGLVNKILGFIGFTDPPAWLAQENVFSMILLGMVWISTGFYTTVIMAAVDRIPPYLYEDCDLAGANAWQRFRHVTLPLSWDVIGVCAVLWTINAIKTFEFILAMAGSSSGLPSVGTWTVSLYSYAMAFASEGLPQYGLAAACSILTLGLVAVMVVLIRKVMHREAIEF